MVAYLRVPLEGVGDTEDVVHHGGRVGARMEEGGAVRAAEVHRREVAKRAGQLHRPRSRRIPLGAAREERGGGRRPSSPEGMSEASAGRVFAVHHGGKGGAKSAPLLKEQTI